MKIIEGLPYDGLMPFGSLLEGAVSKLTEGVLFQPKIKRKPAKIHANQKKLHKITGNT